jgi:hypothetical protein
MVASNVFLDLTREFNEGGLRVVICSGQAVVLHRLAIMSKDGDWIVKEDPAALAHVLSVLARHRARYRYGAPLALPWMRGGWSSHFEFRDGDLRVRTDFFTRPPRLTASDVARLWTEQIGRDPPFVDLRDLAELKKTNREKDYAVIGDLARKMTDLTEQVLYSRSARDLEALAVDHGELVKRLAARRPVLKHVNSGRDVLERELDAERRDLMHANERRIERYLEAGARWAAAWTALDREVAQLDLLQAHEIIVARAQSLLPEAVGDAAASGPERRPGAERKTGAERRNG